MIDGYPNSNSIIDNIFEEEKKMFSFSQISVFFNTLKIQMKENFVPVDEAEEKALY